MARSKRLNRDYGVLSIGMFLSLIGAMALWMAMEIAVGSLAASTLAQETAAKIEGGAEPVYAVNWIEYICPGMAGGFMPTGLRPMACPAKVRVWRSSSKKRAVARVSKLRGSPGLMLLRERGPLEKELPIIWEPGIK